MFKDMVAQLLLKLGVIAMLAGAFPPAAHIYDLLTCSQADAVVEAVEAGGKVRVAFTDGSGRRIVATAAPYHLSMGRHAFESGGSQAAYKRATFRAGVGDTVRVIYRNANPTSLAPHRNPTDALIGLGGIVLGALMLLARRAFMPRATGPSGALQASQAPDMKQRAVAAPRNAQVAASKSDTPPSGKGRAPATGFGRSSSTPARPARAGAVQRDRGWLGRA